MSKENVSQSKGLDQQATKADIQMEINMASEGGVLPGMKREHSVWDVYNNEAKKVDTELVNDWTANLNSLLLFAAIFTAVLTAFVIESKKLLEQDPVDVMVDVMIFFANNGANVTRPLYVQPPFQAPWSAITVNCLFFASLGTSIFAGLASVVALQWVTDYDAAITRGGSSPEDRAKRRQFRYSGVLHWRMSDIIAGIPLLLYSSVALFLSGVTLWMWNVHYIVGLVIAGGAAAVIIFYGGTTLLAVLSASAPFRTPLSRAIYFVSHFSFSVPYFICKAAQFLLVRLGNTMWPGLVPLDTRLILWLKGRHLRGIHFNKRQDRRVEEEPKLGLDAIMWLANQLSIAHASLARLTLLVTELPKLEREIFTFSVFDETSPWLAIFELLAREFIKKGPNEAITTTEMRTASALAQCYSIPKIKEIVDLTAEKEYERDTPSDGYGEKRRIPKVRLGKLYQIPIPIQITIPIAVAWCPNNLVLFLREVAPLSVTNTGALEVAIDRSRWRNWYEDPVRWTEMFDLAKESPSTLSKECIQMLFQYPQVANPGWWIGMAAYLMGEYQGPHLSSILEMQASAWPFMIDQRFFYKRAREESSLLKYIWRIYEHLYPIPCSEHHEFGGYFLLSTFYQVPACKFPIDVEVSDAFPTRNRHFEALLMMLSLPCDHEERVSEILRQHMDQHLLDQAWILLKAVKASQVANIALLIGICTRFFLDRRVQDSWIGSEDVNILSLCIKKALDLPLEQRSSFLIRPLVNHVQELNDLMIADDHRSNKENEAASLAATDAINRLQTLLATILVAGGRNSNVLSCARAHEACCPAIGWLPPHTD